MKNRVFTYIICCIAVFLLVACKKEEKFSEIPYISFVDFVKIDNALGYDDQARLTIHFQDGDGDLGLNENDIYPPFDTSSIYHYNFFIDCYKKIDGEYQLLELDGTQNSRFPRLSDKDSESIEGDISVNVYIGTYDWSTPYDTMKLECHIVDRKLHESNTITVPEFIVKKK